MTIYARLQSTYQHIVNVGDSLQSLFLLAVRLFWGYQFLIGGLTKLNNLNDIVPFFSDLGIPLPHLSAFLVAFFEAAGGALLMVGLLSRLVALPLIVIMIVAFITADIEAVKGIIEDPLNFVNQTPFTFLLASLIIFIFGPGKISLDYLFKSQKKSSSDTN